MHRIVFSGDSITDDVVVTDLRPQTSLRCSSSSSCSANTSSSSSSVNDNQKNNTTTNYSTNHLNYSNGLTTYHNTNTNHIQHTSLGTTGIGTGPGTIPNNIPNLSNLPISPRSDTEYTTLHSNHMQTYNNNYDGDYDDSLSANGDHKDHHGSMENINVVTGSPTPPIMMGLKRKASFDELEDGADPGMESLSMAQAIKNSYEYMKTFEGIRARNFEEMHHQQMQQQQQQQQSQVQDSIDCDAGSEIDIQSPSPNMQQIHNMQDYRSHQQQSLEQHGDDSGVNGSCASSEDLNQTNNSEQGEKITSGSDDEGECFYY